jgi:uncharacterized membrane protein YhaH (DUF805 family)
MESGVHYYGGDGRPQANPICVLNPYPLANDSLPCRGFTEAFVRRYVMEELFQFLFGASGRINRARYWRSLFAFGVGGLLTAVILLTAAGLAAPLFVILFVLVFIPWVLWGFAIHTERLHDRNKSAWWLIAFCLLPGVLGQLAKMTAHAGLTGSVLHYISALAAFVLTIWGFIEIGCLRGSDGSNSYGPDPLARSAATDALRHGT